METAGYASAILIGILLGSMGSGGTILTVPVFVYLMHVNPVLATTYSLFVVGSCSLIGGVIAWIKNTIDFSLVLCFGATSLLSVFLVRRYLVAAIPDELFITGNAAISKGHFLMILFALLMLAAAFSIIYPRKKEPLPSADFTPPLSKTSLLGILTGILTGLLGAGGGFLIIPALVLFGKLPMKTAVGTSLAIITLNSFLGFFSSLSYGTINWAQLTVFTFIAVIGIFIGTVLSGKLQAHTLKKGFGWFILAAGICVIVRELLLL